MPKSARRPRSSRRAVLLLSLPAVIGVPACAGEREGTPAIVAAEPSDLSAAPTTIGLLVPFVAQNPQLPRGCEVTSLTMLLQTAGVAADKMTLAREIDKVPFFANGKHGNPNTGFVGDMYTLSNPGYGVYHAPVERLASRYLPGRVVDLTESSFDDLLTKYVGRRLPVWIVTNATFRELGAHEFTTWSTVSGDVQITWHDHSVVITGYGPDFVLITDPLASTPNKRLAREPFRRAWEQMGRQAISYLPTAEGGGVAPTTDPAASPGCRVWPDEKLRCSNTPNVAMQREPSAGGVVVDTLRSAYSWFECWTFGELHAGGNTTWYRTIGDDRGNRGFAPAAVMGTTSDFDANPSAHGLRRCEP